MRLTASLVVTILLTLGCRSESTGSGTIGYGFYDAKEVINQKGERFDFKVDPRAKGRYLVYFADKCEFLLSEGICTANGEVLEITFKDSVSREILLALGLLESNDRNAKIVLKRYGKNGLSFRYAKQDKTIILERYTLSQTK